MGTFKKTEYSPICKVFTGVFFNRQNSTFHFSNYKSSRPEVFCKKGVPKNFAKFTGKRLCQSFFFNKVAGLVKFLRTHFLTEHVLWLLF